MYLNARYQFRPKDLLRHQTRELDGECFRAIAVLATGDNSTAIETIGQCLDHHHAAVRALGMPSINATRCTLEGLVRDMVTTEAPDPRFLHMCNGAFSLATGKHDLIALLQKTIMPAFFQRFPQGSMHAFASTCVLEELSTILRIEYARQHMDIKSPKDVSSTMRHWHSADPEHLFRSIITLGGFLWPPFVTSYVTGPTQYPVIVNLDPPSKH